MSMVLKRKEEATLTYAMLIIKNASELQALVVKVKKVKKKIRLSLNIRKAKLMKTVQP